MVRIRRFGIIRTANMVAALYLLLSIIVFGLIFVPLAIVGLAVTPGEMGGMSGMVGAGAAGILVLGLVSTVIYAVLGWITTAIGCAIYNLVAGWVGGIEVQLEGLAPPGGWGYPGYPGYGAPGGYGGQPPVYGAPGGYGGQPPAYGTPGSVPPPPPGTPGHSS